MSISRKTLVKSLAVGAALAALAACGSGSNNDQGTSLLAVGYFTDASASTGLSGTIAPLSTDISGVNITLPNGVVLAGDGLMVLATMGIENRLAQQFVQIQRIDCDYNVPGSTLPIPSDAFGTAIVIQGSGAPIFTPNPVDGDTTATEFSRGYVEFPIVSSNLYSYLNVNRESLPQLPFRLVANCRASGVTQAGDLLTTNPAFFTVEFLEVSECCTGGEGEGAVVGDDGGFQEGTGTGGDFDSFGGEAAGDQALS